MFLNFYLHTFIVSVAHNIWIWTQYILCDLNMRRKYCILCTNFGYGAVCVDLQNDSAGPKYIALE
jgi:hypothetical protein